MNIRNDAHCAFDGLFTADQKRVIITETAEKQRAETKRLFPLYFFSLSFSFFSAGDSIQTHTHSLSYTHTHFLSLSLSSFLFCEL
jgi:hypothetical protein